MITVAYYITTSQKKRAILCFYMRKIFIIFPDKDANEKATLQRVAFVVTLSGLEPEFTP